MSSHDSPLSEIDLTTSPVSTTNSQSTMTNMFGCIMSNSQLAQLVVVKDKCNRPTPTYNHNYNPDLHPRDDLPGGYSPYVHRELLYDDRPAIISRFPARHTHAGTGKRLRTQWV